MIIEFDAIGSIDLRAQDVGTIAGDAEESRITDSKPLVAIFANAGIEASRNSFASFFTGVYFIESDPSVLFIRLLGWRVEIVQSPFLVLGPEFISEAWDGWLCEWFRGTEFDHGNRSDRRFRGLVENVGDTHPYRGGRAFRGDQGMPCGGHHYRVGPDRLTLAIGIVKDLDLERKRWR